MPLPRFDSFEPKSIEEAISLKASMKNKAVFLAGGTDVIIQIREGTLRPDALISLESVEELNDVDMNGPISLGSMTPLRRIEKDRSLRKRIPVLYEAADALGSAQIRNVATIGGNLCNAAPSADCAPPLLVLEARMRIASPNGTREIPIKSFFRGPGETVLGDDEMLTHILIPEPKPRTCSVFLKKRRLAKDIAQVNVAVLLVMEGKTCRECRIALGAVAPTPLRLLTVESLLEGKELEESLLKEAQEQTEKDVRPITDVRATESYRRVISGVLMRRAIVKALNSHQKGEG
jgi:carbon-monoxide dehydrogenase medium subunit